MTLRILALALAGLLSGATPALSDFASAIATLESGDFEAAFREFLPLAEAGNADAQWRVGVMLYSGYGVPKDTREAVRWFRRAVDQGHARAMYNLGYAYDVGDPFDRDLDEALRWYRMAAEHGMGDAQMLLGDAYNDGRYGLRRLPKEAQRWYARAFVAFHQGKAKGRPETHYWLGEMYYYGKGVEQDLREASRHLHLAAEAGVAAAQRALGILYLPLSAELAAKLGLPRPGLDILEPDVIESYKWAALAARQDNRRATDLRNWLAEILTPEELAEAMRRVEAWQPRRSGLHTE